MISDTEVQSLSDKLDKKLMFNLSHPIMILDAEIQSLSYNLKKEIHAESFSHSHNT